MEKHVTNMIIRPLCSQFVKACQGTLMKPLNPPCLNDTLVSVELIYQLLIAIV